MSYNEKQNQRRLLRFVRFAGEKNKTMIHYLQYILPVIFIVLGLVIKYSKDPRWNSSRKMANILIILGILTLLGRFFLDYAK